MRSPEIIVIRSRWIPAFARVTLVCGVILADSSQAALVLNQVGDLSGYDFGILPTPSPSQIYTDFPTFNCTVLEDFTVSSSELRITGVTALFRAQGGFISFQDVKGYYLNFFSNVNLAASGLAGDAGSAVIPTGGGVTVTQVIDPGGDHEYGLVQLNVDMPLPSAGNYWVGVSPVSASSTTGQFFLQVSAAGTPGNANAKLANPGLGFGAGALSSLAADYAYSVTVVPEPGALVLGILGVCGGIFRRRRAV